jgi:hypothetical protein
MSNGSYLAGTVSKDKLNCKKLAFTHRVVEIWNELSFDILACNSVNSFKHRLDNFLEDWGFI